MLDMPILKFDKSIKYLEAQIGIQKNNKQLILDIISNIGLILNNSSSNNDNLQSVLDKANEFLQNISNNITTLEQLNLEIKNITSDLNEIVYSKSKSTKTKEYYIAAFSNLKNNIVQYTQNFQNVENKLDIDNNAFNEFIKENEFKYTFNETEDSETTYELASFSVNNESTSVSADIEKQEINEDDIIDNGIEEAIASNEENFAEELIEEQPEEVIEDAVVTEEVVEDQPKIVENKEPVVQNPVLSTNSNPSPVGELIDIFKDVLVNLYENKISEEEFKATITELKNNLPIFNINNETPKTETSIEENLDTNTNQNVIEEENQESEFNEESLLEELLAGENEEVSTLEDLSSNNPISEENVEQSTDIGSDLNILLNDLLDENNLNDENQTSITSVENQQSQTESKHQSIEDIIKKIESAVDKNKILLISEKTNKIYLPYRITELQNYIDYYPNTYKSLADVVEQEFILDLDTFVKHPAKARYSETYNLIRNRSGKSVLKAISYALKLKNKGNLDPAVIAACKNEYELHCYLYCLEQNKFDSFKFFNIIYDVNLLEQ